MSLKEFCQKCDQYSSCPEICAKLEEELSKDFRKARIHKKKKLDKVRSPANFDKITDDSAKEVILEEEARGATYEPMQFTTPPISREKFTKIVNDYAHIFRFPIDKKIFILYLTTDSKLEELADIHGGSVQNVHKKITKYIKIIAGILLKEKPSKKLITPKQFKEFLKLY